METGKRAGKLRPFDVVNMVLISLLILIMAYPLWFVLVGAFNEGKDYMRGGVWFWPRVWTLDNFEAVLRDKSIGSAFVVTIFKCLIGTLTSVLFTCLVSYGLSRPNLKFKKVYIPFIMFTMFFSGGLIPYFILIRDLHLYNTFWVYIIPSLFSVWNMIIIQSFMRELPEALIESAKIDGAGEYRIFIQIILPLCKPVIAAIALFCIVDHWNAYFDSMMYTADPALQTIQLYLKKVITDPAVSSGLGAQAGRAVPAAAGKITAQSVKLAAMTITALPVVAVYPFLQKYFVKGMTIGAVKG